MSSRTNRALQLAILQALENVYPRGVRDLAEALPPGLAPTADELLFTMQYLAEAGLVRSGFQLSEQIGWEMQFNHVAPHVITAAGLDFLADDGGLSAKLNTVTIRFEAAQFAELLARKVEAAQGVNPDERSKLAKTLRELPASAVEKLSSKLLEWGADQAVDALPRLSTWIAQALS